MIGILDRVEDLFALFNNQFDNFDSNVDKFTFNVEQYSQFQSFSSSTFIKVEISNTTSVTDIENASLLVFDEVLDEQTVQTKLADLGIGDRPVFIQYLNAENNSVLVFSQSSEINVIKTFNSQVTLDTNNFSFITGETDSGSITGGSEDDSLITTTTTTDGNTDDSSIPGGSEDDSLITTTTTTDGNTDDAFPTDSSENNGLTTTTSIDNDKDDKKNNKKGLDIKGKKGDDKLIGGDGDDKIKGNQGNDSIFGGKGTDQINGDKGADQIFYSQLGEGIDRLEDFDQEDKLVFNKTVFGNLSTADFTSLVVTSNTKEVGNADLLIFEGKNKDKNQSLDDVLDKLNDLGVGDRPVFALFSEKGQDNTLAFVEGETVDVISTFKNKTKLQADNFMFVKMKEDAEVDEQIVSGTDSDDSLDGSSDADKCYGGNGKDTLNGGGGGDTFIYLNINEGGDTIINFNINIDVLNFNSTSFGNITNQNFKSIVINNSTTSVGNANLLIFNEQIESTNLPATLANLGVDPNNPVFVSVPSEGNNSQTALYFIQNQQVNIVANFNQNLVLNVKNFKFDSAPPAPGKDIVGTPAGDILKGTSGNDTMKGLGDNDRISGDSGNDYLLGGAGDDNLAGGTGNDSLFGNVGNDMLYGKVGDDFMSGEAGFDHLFGGEGKDILLGGAAGDRLNGGAGNDSLTGGSGKDRFIFNTNKPFKSADFGVDQITDFTQGEDLILLDQRTFNTLNSVGGIGFSVVSEFAVVNTAKAVAKSSALIVYNQNTGQLFYNQNGSVDGFGTGGQFAILSTKPELTDDSFQIRVV